MEVRRQLFVFAYRNAFVLHHPFVTAERAVQAPVDEHAKLRFVPPLHAPLAIFDRGSCRRTVVCRPLLPQGKISFGRRSRECACGSTHQSQIVSSVHLLCPSVPRTRRLDVMERSQRSINQPDSELNLPRRCTLGEAADFAYACVESIAALVQRKVPVCRLAPVLNIEDVERLDPELHLEPLRERNALEH